MANYETPEIVELGSFGAETGLSGLDWTEVNWHFDEWN